MPGQDEDHLLGLSSNVELRRFTRFASLPTQVTTEVAQVGSPLSANHRCENVRRPKHEELCKKTTDIIPEEEGCGIWPSSSGGGKHDEPLNSEPQRWYNNPDCTICPSSYETKNKHSKGTVYLDGKALWGEHLPSSNAAAAAQLS